MSVSQNKLNEYITLYLNDVEDYYGEKDLVLTESTLNSLKQLIVESKKDMSIVLKEALVNSTPERKVIIEDFMLYIQEA
jgi:hypothetical protein|tara:strand:+ start:649 stop:885 length:237 start_codon:yes stop_codon:yes gene_type:complete